MRTLTRSVGRSHCRHDILRNVAAEDVVQAIWDKFCARFSVAASCVPLFATDGDACAETKKIGRQRPRWVLARSPECERMILSVTDELVEDHEQGVREFDGMLYITGWKEDGQFIPRYIGKSETVGRNGDNKLSENLRRLHNDKMEFARWGDNYAYHIGELSACVLSGHDAHPKRKNYEAWARTLFEPETKKLKRPTFFWACPWKPSQIGIWEELGSTPLAVQEYLLIEVAAKVSPCLLNGEGLSRSAV